MTQISLSAVIKQEDEGYSVFCPELEVASQGETFEESINNIKEAIELYIESAKEVGIFDEVLEKLGMTEDDLRKEIVLSKAVTANVPVTVAV